MRRLFLVQASIFKRLVDSAGVAPAPLVNAVSPLVALQQLAHRALMILESPGAK